LTLAHNYKKTVPTADPRSNYAYGPRGTYTAPASTVTDF